MIKNIIIAILLLGFIGVVIFLDIPSIQEILRLRKDIEIEREVFVSEQKAQC